MTSPADRTPTDPPPPSMDETILELTKRFYEERALRIARVRASLSSPTDRPPEPRA